MYVGSGSAQPQPGVGYGSYPTTRRPNSNDPWGDAWGTPVGGTGYAGDPNDVGYAAPPKTSTTPQWDNSGNPASPYPDPFAWTTDYNTGVFNHPGYAEDWWQDHASEFDEPSEREQYWNGVSGTFAAGPERSVGAQQGYDTWSKDLGAAGFAETGAAAGPRGTNYTAGAYASRNTGPGYSEQFQAAGGPQFSSYGKAAASSGAPNTTFNSGAVFDRFFNPLSQQSNSEQLWGTDPGLGAYYDRAAETGSERIRNAMAARGLFGSGAALDEERQLYGDLGADRAKHEADYRMRLAGQSDAERRARMGLAGDLGSASDAASLGRSTNARNWAGMLDDTELRQAGEKRAGREFADTFGADRDKRNLDWSSYLDDYSLDKSGDALAWAKAGDDSRFRRSGEMRDWTDLLGDETERNNRTTLDWTKAGGDLAGDADQGKLDRLDLGLGGAKAANDELRNRWQDQFNNLLKVAQSKQGLINDAVDAATKQKVDTLIATLKAKLAAATNADNVSQMQRDEIDALIGQLGTILGSMKDSGGSE